MQKSDRSAPVSNTIDQTKYYNIIDEIHICCDAQQFRHICKAHGEYMGCYFCTFDYTEPCGCDE
jgi:hypothetical protein